MSYNPTAMYDKTRADKLVNRLKAAGHDPRYIASLVAATLGQSPTNGTGFKNETGPFSLFSSKVSGVNDLASLGQHITNDLDEINSQLSYAMNDFNETERTSRSRIAGDDPQATQYAQGAANYNQRTQGAAEKQYAALGEQVYLDYFGSEEPPEAVSSELGFPIEPTGQPTPLHMGTPAGVEEYVDPATIYMGQVDPALVPPEGESLDTVIEAATSTPQGRTLAKKLGAAAAPKVAKVVDSTMESLYGDRLLEMDGERKKIRQRAVLMALAEGFQAMTLRGRPANYTAILNSRLQQEAALDGEEKELKMKTTLTNMAKQHGFGNMVDLIELGGKGQGALLDMIIKKSIVKTSKGKTSMGVTGREALMRAAKARGMDHLVPLIGSATGALLKEITAMVTSKGTT